MAAATAAKPSAVAAIKPGAVAESKPAKGKKGGVGIVTLLAIVLLACAATGAATWFLAGRKAEAAAPGKNAEHGEGTEKAEGGKAGDGAKKPGQAEYLALDPAFVVNTADEESQHYLQTDVQVMARNDAALDAVKAHMPRIRNNLLLLFGQQRTTDIRDRAGRERLRAAALKEVQDVLQAETGKPGVEALYFTSFVTQ